MRLLNVVLIKLQYLMMWNDILSLKNASVTISIKRPWDSWNISDFNLWLGNVSYHDHHLLRVADYSFIMRPEFATEKKMFTAKWAQGCRISVWICLSQHCLMLLTSLITVRVVNKSWGVYVYVFNFETTDDDDDDDDDELMLNVLRCHLTY